MNALSKKLKTSSTLRSRLQELTKMSPRVSPGTASSAQPVRTAPSSTLAGPALERLTTVLDRLSLQLSTESRESLSLDGYTYMWEYLTYSELREENQDFLNEIVEHVLQAPTTVVVHHDPDTQYIRFLTQPEQRELEF